MAELGLVINAKEENNPNIQMDRNLEGDKREKTKNEVKNNPLTKPRVIEVIISYSIGIKIGITKKTKAGNTYFFRNKPNAKTTKGKIPIQAVVIGKA